MFPATTIADAEALAIAGLIAMASKYIIAINKKHIFNPVAIGALLAGLLGFGSGIWWVGSTYMLLPTLILGLLILRKTRRMVMGLWFLGSSLATILVVGTSITSAFTSWPLIFFGSIMLTEPLTTPPTKKLRVIYAVITGILMNIPWSLGFISASPELALILANIFSYAVSLKKRFVLVLKERKLIAKDLYEFSFGNREGEPSLDLGDKGGQYLEWTLPHENPDSRGVRRYFTIASGYDEPYLKLGVKIMENSSTFKKKLLSMNIGEEIAVGALAGDFILPADMTKKLVFIAGGIGVTPFRSMIKSLTASKEKRDIVLIYSVKAEDEIAYREIFDEAQAELGIKVIYLVSNYIDQVLLDKEIPDYKERTFYLSGPSAMVDNYKKLFRGLGVAGKDMVTDYFPGF
jgi:ferredoxin-NADP reductase